MAKTCRGCGREFAGGETFCPDDGSRLSSTSQLQDLAGVDPLIGTTLDGRYKLLRAIGEGGMGIVYEAEHVLIEKRVAIKVLRETFTRRPDVVERFRQEAKSASRIGHPNIVDVSDFGETQQRASYIVMEMLKGEDLADVLSRECALSPTRAVMIVFQIGKALAAAHAKGITHRDLKPENIYLIERDGRPDFVKVVDFGVAKMSDIETLGGRKLTRTGMIFGTPEYMSPEHAGGKSLDHRVDVYALGVILYELLTGRVPFEGDNFMEVLAKHAHDPVPELRDMNPGTRVSPELARVVGKALEKSADVRYQSMDELVEALRTVAEMPRSGADAHLPPEWARSAPPPPPATSTAPIESRARRTTVRQRALPGPWLLGGGAALALVAGALLWLPSSSPHQPSSAAVSLALAPTLTSTSAPVARVAAPALVAQPSVVAGLPPPVVDEVPLRVRTEPAQAQLFVDGRGEVCASTPCEFSVPRGAEITLRARSGSLSVVRSLRAEIATELDLVLRAPAKANVSTRAVVHTTTRARDIKVPAAFR
jgi:eukaryotic-like serine/threonine-protein kinase